MKVLLRLLLLAGAAAAIALMVRDSLVTRVARALAEPTRHFAALTPTLQGPRQGPRTVAAPPAVLPMLPATSVGALAVPLVPMLPPAPPKLGLVKAAAPTKHHVVTRKELEDAIASRLSGANAVLVRDDDGKPAGLRLSGVARLASFGVRDGDVLVAANGMPLRTADEALTALGALKDAKHVTVSLRRAGSLYSVPLELDDSPSAPSAPSLP